MIWHSDFPKKTYLVEDLICKEITKTVQFKISGTRLVKILLCGVFFCVFVDSISLVQYRVIVLNTSDQVTLCQGTSFKPLRCAHFCESFYIKQCFSYSKNRVQVCLSGGSY